MGKFSRRLKPSWTLTIGRLHEEQNVAVTARCRTCHAVHAVDLLALIDKVGCDYSLWNRSPRCTLTPGCAGRVHFRWTTGTWTHAFEDDGTFWM